MVDLHLHTYYSDGTLSPEALVERAARRGITTIAITDHDGVNGISEALDAGKKYGVKVIPSIELSTGMVNEDQQIYMHILGYHININNEPLKRAVEEIRKKREERNIKLFRTLNKIGFQLDKEDLLQRPEQDYVGKPNFALAMTKRGYINNPKDAFTPGKYLRHPEIRKIHREKIHVKEAISLINGAGGKAVLAHPYKIAFLRCDNEGDYERLERLLDSLQEWGLSGMECYYSTHTPEQAEKLVEIAKRRGLLITSGSDFHGPDFNPALDIGVTGGVF